MLGAWVMALTVRNKVLTMGRAGRRGDHGEGRQAWGPRGGQAGVGTTGRAGRRGDHGEGAQAWGPRGGRAGVGTMERAGR